MKQLSIRGFDEELENRLRELAKKKGVSLNKAAILLLRKGAGVGLDRSQSNVIGGSLDHLMGRWSEKQEREFLKTLEVLETVDESLWS
jgi:hypothetical protein